MFLFSSLAGRVGQVRRSRFFLAVFLVSVLLPHAMLAQSLLCLEEKATGFNWRNGEWVQVEFLLDKYVISKKNEGHPSYGACAERIIANDGSFDLAPLGTDYTARYGCYEVKKLGEEALFLNDCVETFNRAGDKLLAVTCDGETSYRAIVDGEFFHKRTYAGGSLLWRGMSQKDSLVMSIGKCSSID